MVALARPRHGANGLLSFLVSWAVLAVAVWVAAEIVDGIRYDGWESIAAVSLVLALLNAIVRPVLFWLSLPLTVLTLGLFLIVLNAVLFWAADELTDYFDRVDFAIDHFFWDAVFGAVIVSIVGWALGLLIPRH
jgi:putative membrane protein